MTNEKRESVIRKISHLLRLAENEGSTPGEAAAAMGRAQHLMDQHKIDAAMAENFDDEKPEEIRDWEDPLDTMTGGVLPTWLGRLAMVISKANGCHVYQSRDGKRKTLKILGGSSDATTARYLYKWTRRQIDEMAKDYSGNGKTWINNWRLGVVEEIQVRLAEAKKAAADEARAEKTGTALVVVENAIAKVEQRHHDVVAWSKANLGLRGGSRSSSRYDSSARAQGRRDGKRVSLNRSNGGRLGGGSKLIK